MWIHKVNAGGLFCLIFQCRLFGDTPYLAARECLLRLTATISARIEIAISSGVIAPRSRPAGALSFAKRSAGTPRFASTVRYLGIEVDDALAISEQIDV